MQLHVCLLLFIITTDKTWALWHHRCGGNVSLDPKPAGHINLTLPRIFNETNGLNYTKQQSDENLSLCTWLIDVPLGGKVLVKVEHLGGGLNITVRCVWTQEDQDLVLEIGKTVLLPSCARNKAILTWTGTQHFPGTIQLWYFVQEDERNSSEDRTTRHLERGLVGWSKTGTSFTRTTPVSQEVLRGKDRVKGPLYQGLQRSARTLSLSGPSSPTQGLHPTSPLQGLSVAGKTDRETLPLPEEGQHNGVDTSGATHLTDSPISAREGTHPYFHTQHTLSTDPSNTETNFGHKLHRTQMVPIDASDSNTTWGTEKHKYAVTHTHKYADRHATTQAPPTVSTFSIPPFTSSPPELHSRTNWERGPMFNTHGEAVSEEHQAHSWRGQESTDTLKSDLTSAVTSEPLKSLTERPQDASNSLHTDTEAAASTTSSLGPSRSQLPTTHITELHTAVSTVAAASFHPTSNRTDSFGSTTSQVTSHTAAFESSHPFDSTMKHHTTTSSTQGQTNPPQITEGLATSTPVTQTPTHNTQTNGINAHTGNAVSSLSGFTEVDDRTSRFTSLSSAPRATQTLGDVVRKSADTGTTAKTDTLPPTDTRAHKKSSTNPQTSLPPLAPTVLIHSTTPSYKLQTHITFSGSLQPTRISLPFTSPTMESAAHTPLIDPKTMPVPFETPTTESTSSLTWTHLPLQTSATIPATYKQPHNYIATTQISLLSLVTSAKSNSEVNTPVEVVDEDESWQWLPSSTTAHTTTAGPQPPSWPTPHPSQESYLDLTPSALTSAPALGSTTSQTPRFYIVPDQPAAIRVESIELLLQIIVEESRSALDAGLEEDTAAWVEPYLQKAPGFSRLLAVWSSGHAVQILVKFETVGALQWLSMTGPTSLLERTGLGQAVREARSFRSSKITNVTLGGVQTGVCDWLLQCPSGYKCISQLGTANYSCSSICRFDYCHHHGICTHHPGQLPVCRCLVGEDFWYMGQRCDLRMTRARLVGACLATLLITVIVISILAFAAVRRYRAILIQAKVDQTRSSYRRFNHFDELSGRFWLRSWAGSADSLDNPAFMRSDELLHLRALDRPCCYHDDTLSLASTCPSHGPRINTIYPHSSQYAWRGSEMSMGDGVLDSGKASDLSVCSWPVEPIQWTPFPLLQQLASHRTPTVRMSRPRSYCEGMELVDLEKSWTA
ncbi:Interphotoreceptor matrix proteoglycan 2 Sialoprotein associated with cones and rods proteoglycan [Channa argus]|uniref:Interphotoreceptor matrix proteoglycan 2 Sialoprotein associated with cones and rods proteoglycan n=1 Tax=Channa argus TaxID=215402 RepID=A0A6G1PCQ7_CHAAH|nr:Interphotoreceptor matrix proteoglycan 2 Sialoprotein associated with cones and rods proteoglycan [Channa argus]